MASKSNQFLILRLIKNAAGAQLKLYPALNIRRCPETR